MIPFFVDLWNRILHDTSLAERIVRTSWLLVWQVIAALAASPELPEPMVPYRWIAVGLAQAAAALGLLVPAGEKNPR